jgi:hypothetical protein
MDFGWALWGLFLVVAFIIGLCAIILSTRIVNWVFSWSALFLQQTGNVPTPNAQRAIAVWFIRFWGFLCCCGSLAMLISGLVTNF